MELTKEEKEYLRAEIENRLKRTRKMLEMFNDEIVDSVLSFIELSVKQASTEEEKAKVFRFLGFQKGAIDEINSDKTNMLPALTFLPAIGAYIITNIFEMKNSIVFSKIVKVSLMAVITNFIGITVRFLFEHLTGFLALYSAAEKGLFSQEFVNKMWEPQFLSIKMTEFIYVEEHNMK